MKITAEKKSGLSNKFRIDISAQEVQERVDLEVKDLSQKVKIDGFRKGHAPQNIIKQQYQEKLLNNAISYFIENANKQIMADNNFELAARPRFEENGELDKDKGFSFFLIFELWPTIPEIKYNKVSATKINVKLTNKEIEDQLLIIADRFASLEEIKESATKAENGNVLNIDYLGKKDGVAFEGGTAQNQMLELGSNTFIPGFEEQLIGVESGIDKVITVKFPEEYHNEDLKGKEATFDVKVNKIYKKVTPAIDDELAKQLGEENLETLKNKIITRAADEYDAANKSIIRSRVIKMISEEADFALPESIFENEKNARKEELEKSNEKKTDKEKLSAKEIEKQAQENAKKALQMAYLKHHWNNTYKITVTNEDFEKEVMKESFNNGNNDYQQMIGIYNQYPKLKEYLLSAIEERKIFDNIFPLLKIKDKDMNKSEADIYLEKLKADENLL